MVGAIDSKGIFHPDPEHAQNLASIALDRNNPKTPGAKAAFDALFRDERGNARHHYPESWYRDVFRQLLPIAYQVAWGATFPDMEVLMDGELIFQPDHLKPKPAAPLPFRGTRDRVS